jgi:hypothetical protein
VSIFPKLTDPVIAIDIEVKEEKDLKKFGPGSSSALPGGRGFVYTGESPFQTALMIIISLPVRNYLTG